MITLSLVIFVSLKTHLYPLTTRCGVHEYKIRFYCGTIFLKLLFPYTPITLNEYHAWFHLHGLRRAGTETQRKIKMKIYVTSGIQTSKIPHRKLTLLTVWPGWEMMSVHLFKERGGGQTFSTSFWMRFSQAPLCRCRFKVIFDDIFLLSGNNIEYICFWRFNSIIMTWNKWLVFTKSVIMALNNISPWPCPLGVVCLPCVIIWLYSTPLPSCEPLV